MALEFKKALSVTMCICGGVCVLVAVAAGTGAFGGVGAVGYATSELNKNGQPSCDVDPNSDPDTDKDATTEVEKKITFNRAYLPYPDVYLDSNHRINRTLDAGRAVTSAPTTGAQPTQQCKSKRKQERTTTTIAWGASAPGWGADVGAFFESSNAVAAQKMNEFEAAWGSYFVPLEQKFKDSLPKDLTITSSKRSKDGDSSSKLHLCPLSSHPLFSSCSLICTTLHFWPIRPSSLWGTLIVLVTC